MKIIDQAIDHITVYDIREQQIRKGIRYESLSQVMRSFGKETHMPHPTEDIVCLFDEQLFSYYAFSLHFTCSEPCTITTIKSLIQDKISYIKEEHGISAPYVIHRLSHIIIDGVAEQYVLGRTGHITLSLELCILRPEGAVLAEIRGRDIFSHPRVSIYPRNYFTLEYLTQHLSQDSYALLFIEKEMSQLVRVNKGRYTDVQYINIGMHLLKSCYQEHDVEKYFYTSRGEVKENQFLSKVIDEAVSFFTDTLSKRVHQYVDTSQSLIVTGDIVHNPSFLPLFQDSYRVFGTGYILPLQPLQHDRYEHTFSANEIPIASYLQYAR